MSTVTAFRVVMLNDNNVCFPGQVLIGQVLIHLSSDIKMRGIHVTCCGCGRVGWSVGKQRHDHRDEYVNETVTVFGKRPGENGTVILQAGQHTLPFEIHAPPGIPGSFEADLNFTAYTRYWLSAVIDRPWKSNMYCKTYFTMGSVLDLNAVPTCRTPLTKSTSKNTVCNGCFEEDVVAKRFCCCCESEPLTVNMSLNKTGFVPGESIAINSEICNPSDSTVQKSTLALIMKITVKKSYRKGRSTYTQSINAIKVLNRVSHGQVNQGEKVQYTADLLHVPPIPPTGLPGCDIIDVEYFVRLTVQTTLNVLVIELDADITIGTIPLCADMIETIQHGFNQIVREQPTASVIPVYADIPPPSYMQSALGTKNLHQDEAESETEDAGTSGFTPTYTYYHLTSENQTDELPRYESLFKDM